MNYEIIPMNNDDLVPWKDMERCQSVEHDPPRMVSIPAGHKMVHTCPQCGKVSVTYSKEYVMTGPEVEENLQDE